LRWGISLNILIAGAHLWPFHSPESPIPLLTSLCFEAAFLGAGSKIEIQLANASWPFTFPG